jgi:hypothetical protein
MSRPAAEFRGFDAASDGASEAAAHAARGEPDTAGQLVRTWVAKNGRGAPAGGFLAPLRGNAGPGRNAASPRRVMVRGDVLEAGHRATQWVEKRVEALRAAVADGRTAVGGRLRAGASLRASAPNAAYARGGTQRDAAGGGTNRRSRSHAAAPASHRAGGASAARFADSDSDDSAAPPRRSRGGTPADTVAVDLPEVAVRDGKLFMEGRPVDDVRQKARANPPSAQCAAATQARSPVMRPQSSNGLDVFDVVMHHLLSLDSARPQPQRERTHPLADAARALRCLF